MRDDNIISEATHFTHEAERLSVSLSLGKVCRGAGISTSTVGGPESVFTAVSVHGPEPAPALWDLTVLGWKAFPCGKDRAAQDLLSNAGVK